MNRGSALRSGLRAPGPAWREASASRCTGGSYTTFGGSYNGLAVLPALLALALALPPAEQLTLPSLPKALAELLRQKLPAGDQAFATFDVRHFQAGTSALWIVGLPCAADTAHGTSPKALYLQHGGGRFTLAGTAAGELVEVDYPEQPNSLPDQLYFYVGSGKTEPRLRRTAGTFEPTTVAHRFRDPLTQESLTASEMRQRAYADLKSGNAVSAAGRYTLLCAAECTVGDLEALAAADLGARLFPQADKALRAALAQPGHQPADWQSLASLLRANGENAAASEAESRFSEETQELAKDGGA